MFISFLLAACSMTTPNNDTVLLATPPPPVLPEPGMEVSSVEAIRMQLEYNFERVDFETGTTDMTAEGRDALAANSAILAAHPDVKVVVQGHADERGSEELNLALGMDRAKAVREVLVEAGASQDQIMVATYGERAPLVEGADTPAVWSVNRRAEFRVAHDPDGLVDGSLDNPLPDEVD